MGSLRGAADPGLLMLTAIPSVECLDRGQEEGDTQKAGERKEGLEDLLWTLLNSREFLLNH